MSSCLPLSLSPPMYLNFSVRCRFRHSPITSAARRHHRRRLLKYSPNRNQSPSLAPTIFKLSDDSLHITLKSPLNSLQQLESKLNQFINLGREAIDDLRTVVTVDGNNGGVVISCGRSTAEFFAAVIFASLIIVFAFRSLFRIRRNDGEVLLYKRDRSLGGKEVVVGKRENSWTTSSASTPLSSDNANNQKRSRIRTLNKRWKKELPQWWPQTVSQVPGEIDNKEEYQRIANQLIQVIMDRKMSGEDVSTNDIVQLRHICKTYGVRAFISTTNTRDSLYRVSVNFVMDYCESIRTLHTSIQINGEDVRVFIAGLADNIGLESAQAARMVSAAVAARTRSKILQAWALEVQNRHPEALVELFKVCVIHRIFPPEQNSPEMEMVARGLDKSLDVDQREHILNSFIAVCGEDIHQSVVEALGLVGVMDEQGNQNVEI